MEERIEQIDKNADGLNAKLNATTIELVEKIDENRQHFERQIDQNVDGLNAKLNATKVELVEKIDENKQHLEQQISGVVEQFRPTIDENKQQLEQQISGVNELNTKLNATKVELVEKIDENKQHFERQISGVVEQLRPKIDEIRDIESDHEEKVDKLFNFLVQSINEIRDDFNQRLNEIRTENENRSEQKFNEMQESGDHLKASISELKIESDAKLSRHIDETTQIFSEESSKVALHSVVLVILILLLYKLKSKLPSNKQSKQTAATFTNQTGSK